MKREKGEKYWRKLSKKYSHTKRDRVSGDMKEKSDEKDRK